MKKFVKGGAAALAVIVATTAAQAIVTTPAAPSNGWTLDAENSKISFGSVKNNYIGESHSFADISGTVSPNGEAMVEIVLASVQTNVDKRNERMIKHVFTAGPKAALSAQIDMDAMASLPVGGMTNMTVEGELTLLGEPMPLDVPMFAIRVAEDKVMVMSDDLIFVATDDAGLDLGVDKLLELAGLDDITRAVPASVRLVFDAN
jgi:polyisoprenoid-binding protein YceI